MAKRKITLTMDDELLDAFRTLRAGSLSAVVNAALAAEVDRRARAAAVERLLADWDAAFGPVTDEVAAQAAALFDDADLPAAASWPAAASIRRATRRPPQTS